MTPEENAKARGLVPVYRLLDEGVVYGWMFNENGRWHWCGENPTQAARNVAVRFGVKPTTQQASPPPRATPKAREAREQQAMGSMFNDLHATVKG